MALLPDVPLVIVVAHLGVLGALVTYELIITYRRLELIRQNRQDE